MSRPIFLPQYVIIVYAFDSLLHKCYHVLHIAVIYCTLLQLIKSVNYTQHINYNYDNYNIKIRNKLQLCYLPIINYN